MRLASTPSPGSSEVNPSRRLRDSALFAYGGLMAASLLVATGTIWAYTRPSNDFSVFYAAWTLVLQGRGAEIYQATPDRFLYAPGFAWIFCFLALLPRGLALAIWCFGKAASIGLVVRGFGLPAPGTGRERGGAFARAGLAAWAAVLLARPILIDFQYGQVNLLILGACAWALGRFCRPGSEGSWADGLSWAALGIAALAKLFPLPLALIPFLSPSTEMSVPRGRLRWSRAGVVLGILVIFLIPAWAEGVHGAWTLLLGWRGALIERGLPLESHNQSFPAFLHHYLSGLPTEVIAEHRRRILLGFPLLSRKAMDLLSLSWMMTLTGLILALIFRGPRPGARRGGDRVSWMAALIGLLILPSHLVWKPYFVLGLPLGCVSISRARGDRARGVGLLILFAVVNLSGFDLLGQDLGARLEAACILLWAHLALFWTALGD